MLKEENKSMKISLDVQSLNKLFIKLKLIINAKGEK